MKKKTHIVMLLLALCSLSISATTGPLPTIDAWKSWLGYQDNGIVFGHGLSDTIVLGGTTYFKCSGDSICYRRCPEGVSL